MRLRVPHVEEPMSVEQPEILAPECASIDAKELSMGNHFISSNGATPVTIDNVKFLGLESQPPTLLALEAEFIRQLKPSVNTPDENRGHT